MQKCSILYLDDEQRLLDIFEEMFGDSYDVKTASTVSEARSVLAECGVDIIISDQLMPEIEGTEFLREAAATCPDSFRIMLTGHAGVGQMLPEISSGIIQLFVAKPWKEEQMRQILERAAASLDLRRP
ncbi:MAG TPA: response regulator [Pyrinomonadaceae bacterium]|jgi:DNA-binding NtrC family response regulator